jgi:Protein of unknown function (DUF3800)
MLKPTAKLYAYVDESGQDTKGRLFVVSVLVVAEKHDEVGRELLAIEQLSGKGAIKWHRARRAYRQFYIEEIARLRSLKGAIFVQSFADTKEYSDLTAYTTARAILTHARDDYEVTVFVDGLRKSEIPKFGRGLRSLRVRIRKVRGVRRDENNQYIRLVDAICGLVRDAAEGNPWAEQMVDRLKRRGLLVELR